MATSTGIQWTDATWNPVSGCTRISAGCDNCYAATLAARLLGRQYTDRLPVVDTIANRTDPFALRTWPERLHEPSRWRRPRMVFVNSMSDLFHHDLSHSYVREVFQIMLAVRRHTYQILTKRPSRVASFVAKCPDLFEGGKIPSHIWIGTSIEHQRTAHREDNLARVPADVRFLSCEPLLGPLELSLDLIDWVIVGGESGPVHRPLDLQWAREIRDQCRTKGVPFFFKQVGGRTPKAKGRMLDGRTWDEFPTWAIASSEH